MYCFVISFPPSVLVGVLNEMGSFSVLYFLTLEVLENKRTKLYLEVFLKIGKVQCKKKNNNNKINAGLKICCTFLILHTFYIADNSYSKSEVAFFATHSKSEVDDRLEK